MSFDTDVFLSSLTSTSLAQGAAITIVVDKDTAARLGISSRDIDNAMYNFFGQRQVSTIYGDLNQY